MLYTFRISTQFLDGKHLKVSFILKNCKLCAMAWLTPPPACRLQSDHDCILTKTKFPGYKCSPCVPDHEQKSSMYERSPVNLAHLDQIRVNLDTHIYHTMSNLLLYSIIWLNFTASTRTLSSLPNPDPDPSNFSDFLHFNHYYYSHYIKPTLD